MRRFGVSPFASARLDGGISFLRFVRTDLPFLAPARFFAGSLFVLNPAFRPSRSWRLYCPRLCTFSCIGFPTARFSPFSLGLSLVPVAFPSRGLGWCCCLLSSCGVHRSLRLAGFLPPPVPCGRPPPLPTPSSPFFPRHRFGGGDLRGRRVLSTAVAWVCVSLGMLCCAVTALFP